MRKLIVALTISCASACGPAQHGSPAPAEAAEAPIPVDPSAGPSGADSLTWMFSGPEENGSGRPRLMYSARHSDEMGLNLQCDGAQVRALIVRNAPDVVPETWTFSLISGGRTAELVGGTEGEPASEMFVRAVLPLNSPVLANLRSTGEITLRDQDSAHVFDAVDDSERRAIEQFFLACE